MELTDKQQDVLDFLRSHIASEGHSPTLKTIADHFGWKSPNSAQEHLLALKRKNRVERTPRGYIPND